TMEVTIVQHITKVRAAGPGAISFYYYSGHGLANADTHNNYLIPVDIKSVDETLWANSIDLTDITDKLVKGAPLATHFVLFDACRNELRLGPSMSKGIGESKGFEPIAAKTGLLVAYATAPSMTATDKGTGAGIYARTLSEEILRSGVEAVTMFRNVQIHVLDQ